jgi:glyceraldehyde 3-phosphate dehydrogenase
VTTRIAISGFGRIGRQLIKAVYERYWDALEIVAIGISESHITENRALLLKHESVYGTFGADIQAVVKGPTNAIRVAGRQFDIVGRDPYGPVPVWKRWGVDLVIGATGIFKDREAANKHLEPFPIPWTPRSG